MTLQTPIPHSISNMLEGIKGEKYGPKLITLANSFYAYQRRKRTSSSPSGRVPSSLIKFSLEERTICMMHQIIDSSRTHGTRPDYKDSTPSAELYVCLLTSVSLFKLYHLSPLFIYSFKSFKYALTAHSCRAMCAQYTWGLLIQKLNIVTFWALCPPHMRHFPICAFFHHYMHRYDLSFGQAGLPGSCVYALCSR